MKNLTKKIIIGSLLSLPMISNAQFIPLPGAGRTLPAIQKIGIGFFPTNASVQAKLHINQFLLANNPATNGLLFRTDGSNTVANTWSMFTGATANSVTEKFRMYVPANSSNVVLQAQQPNSRMLFNTNGAINRMLIVDGDTLNTNGYIAMGNNLPAGFAPTARLHLFQNEFGFLGLVNTTTKYSDLSTGTGNNDGFEVGYSSSSTIQFSDFAQLRNRENTPMKFFTSNRERIHVNANRNIVLDGYTVPTNGFVGIGSNFNGLLSDGLWDTPGPFSLLHLNGVTGANSVVFAGGYRPWMKTGITFSDQIDISYIGLRSVFPAGNINEMVINMSNDPINSAPFGPDDIVFRFSVAGNGNTTIDDDFDVYNDLDGRHLARFTGTGEFGLGPVFGVIQSNPNYVRPASLQHLSLMKMRSVYTQYTNRNTVVGSGTGETAADGFRIGILGNNLPARNGNAMVYQQEERHLLFSTNANTTVVTPLNTLERMRITSINAPTELASNGYGVYNPAGLNGNLTRVAISHNPQNPVTRPLSLLHLGYNTGLVGFTPTSTDGWRNWMDIGTFTNNGTDNMYVGLKTEAGAFPASDRQDAIINWGDNDASNPLNGPDNLRFIFTSTTTGAGNSPANTNNGLEVARMEPTLATTLTAPNYGMMGIGDFSPLGPNNALADAVDAKLDIDGDLRIRTVTQRDTLTKVLVIDSADHNRVHWRSMASLGGGSITADNGLSIDPLNANNVQLGNDIGLTTAQLTNDREVPMNDNNIYFTDNLSPTPFKNQIGIGVPISTNLSGQLHVLADKINHDLGFSNIVASSVGGFFENTNNQSNTFDNATWNFGVYASSFGNIINTQNNISPLSFNIGIYGEARNNKNAYGIYGRAFENNNASFNGSASIGGVFESTTNTNNRNIGVRTNVQAGIIQSIGVLSRVFGNQGQVNMGGDFCVNATNATINYGIISNALGATTNFAGFFSGDVVCTGGGSMCPSDAALKTNVQPLTNATIILNKLIPKTFNFDTQNYPSLNLPTVPQMGLIAQEVDTILPNIVGMGIAPEERDSIGNIITPAVSFKTIKYQELIPLLIAGFKEQQAVLNNKDSIIDNLETRLATLEACINQTGICNNHEQGNHKENTQSVTLQNLNAIILD